MSPWRLCLAFALIFACAPVRADVLHVDSTATGSGDGSSWADAYVDLQLALAAATIGDELWVAAGTYKPTSEADPTATFQLISGVQIYGGFSGAETTREERDPSAHETILSGAIGPSPNPWLAELDELVRRDAPRIELSQFFRDFRENYRAAKTEPGNSQHVLNGSGVDETAVLDGFTVTQGFGGQVFGGGMIIDGGSPSVRNTIFRQNMGPVAGGIAILNQSAPILSNLTFVDNIGVDRGGAIYCSQSELEITNSTFDGNLSSIGGAVSVHIGGSGVFDGCLFLENEGQDGGGGIAAETASLRVENSSFVDNWELFYGGGAIYASGATVELTSCEFRGNSAQGSEGGGAILMYSPNATLRNVVFTGNSYGGLFSGGGAIRSGSCALTFMNVSFQNNQCNGGANGGALYLSGCGATIVNSILSGNSALFGDGDEIFSVGSSPLISHSLIEGSGGSGAGWDVTLGVDGGGNVDADPRFVAPPTDLTLQPDSPAIDTGDLASLPPELTTDLAGSPRVSGPEVDMGAYEFECVPLVVEFGSSWDGVSLQEILDAEYGAGAIDAATGYAGADCSAPSALWLDTSVSSWVAREIASSGNEREFGWHVEDFANAVLDSADTGVLLASPTGLDIFEIPAGTAHIGFYLNPMGPGDGVNAPEPEIFYLNRHRNDAGADGGGDLRPPDGGDPQCLLFDITHLNGGVPTYVLAWEEADYGSPLSVSMDSLSTDNDFQDLVVEVQVESPIPVLWAKLESETSEAGLVLRWSVSGFHALDALELWREGERGGRDLVHARRGGAIPAEGDWSDPTPLTTDAWYWIRAEVGGRSIESEKIRVVAPSASVAHPVLVGASPNPFNPSTTIVFELPTAGRVTLSIHDLAGRHVTILSDGWAPAGRNELPWDGRDHRGQILASGVYFCRLEMAGFVDARRMVLLK